MKLASPSKKNRLQIAVTLLLITNLPMVAFAAGPPVPSEMSNTLAQMLMAIIVALLLVIVLLANVVMGAADIYTQRFKESKQQTSISDGAKIFSFLLLCLVSNLAMAAETPASAVATVPFDFGGLSASSFYTMVTVIGVELVIILALLYNLKNLLAKEAVISVSQKVIKEEKPFDFGKWWWEKFNSLKPVHEEADIDLGHDYDGIRELDNRLPPWWLYGFYLCIVVAAIYMYRYHVAYSAPLSKEELTISLNEAEIAKAEFLKTSANKVDENTVTYLTDAANMDAGKKIFIAVCAACHLNDGGGSVGPNLTDKYWIHGGGIKDIFKTLKYGWPEKGMKSWKDDYSPVQLAQIAGYVKSLEGTKPAKGKEPQGELYQEVLPAAAADSVTTKDSDAKTESLKK